ncbi:MAG: hypothetical protein ACREMQ_18265 [Longimicrobiales bacterium]
MTEAHDRRSIGLPWTHARPSVLVIACSDGRLQEATDEFLARHLGIRHYDRLYVPGGAGALSPSGRDFLRARELQKECRFLVDAHHLEHVIGVFHGPAPDGPPEAMCGDYRRKFDWATVEELRAQQERDAGELIEYRADWAARAAVHIYRGEVGMTGNLSFVTLHADPKRGTHGQIPVDHDAWEPRMPECFAPQSGSPFPTCS